MNRKNKSMNRKSCLLARCAAICLIVVQVAATASARTVYDAGKALKANCTAATGAYANPYTDANDGKWSYFITALSPVANTVTLKTGSYSWSNGGTVPLNGFASDNTKQATSIRVHTSAVAVTLSSGEVLQPDELVLFPGNSDSQRACVRFTAPEDGWYSAFVSAHDLVKESSAIANSGVEVCILAQGNLLVSQIVSLEEYASGASTHRFDFQMPVRHLAAGETIDVFVSRNGANSSDNTGVIFTVTKEDGGSFYDSGIALTNNIATSYSNPYGTIKDGTWYFLKTSVPNSSVDFVSWAPANFGHGTNSRIDTKGTRSGGLSGFGRDSSANSPYVVVNAAATKSIDNTAPCELQVHPYGSDARVWTTIRFRPPVSGYFSGSIVARDLNRGTTEHNGVDVYLLVSEHVVASAYISAETFSATAHLMFDARLMAAGEPVDIVVSPHTQASSDATAISAIFRCEDVGVYDAGKSYYDVHAFRGASEYFSDSFDSAANWLVAMKADPWAEEHASLGTYMIPSGNKLAWWVHAVNNQNNGTAPRFAMATNGIVSVDSLYLNQGAPMLATTPYELVVQPQNPPQDSSAADKYNASLRAEVPSNGIYRVRSYVRDLNNNTSEGDGVRMILSANSYAPASAIVSRDSNDYPYEAALAADRLWLKQGEALYFTVDPRSGSTSDATALSACYVKENDAADAPGVINIDITGSDDNYVGVGREGWSTWTKWNGIRFSSKLPAVAERTKQNCREADGTTKRNVAFTLKRDSNANIDKGWSPTGYTGPTLLRIWAKSTGPSDTYTFTLSKLKKNEPYTLYLYSSKGRDASGNAVDGNAVFTVGGVTKSADEMWNLRDAMVLTRFEVVSDANGEISGTFAAGDADTSSLADSLQGGAFNGLTIVGEFPEYDPPGMGIILR